MSVIISKDTRVVVQGITGNEGRFHSISMKSYGTNIVAGCTPGKGGQLVEGIPVYDTVEIENPTPPANYPPIVEHHGSISPVTTGVAGVIGGTLLGASAVVAKWVSREHRIAKTWAVAKKHEEEYAQKKEEEKQS